VTELLVQAYLRSGGTADSLLIEHGVKLKPHNGKVSLVYDQLAAKETNQLANQCRGLVLREGTWDIVAYPFDRFFNHDQPCAAPIDWATAAYEEKLDGTLIIAHWDDGCARWHVATRSMCEAHGDINGVGTFAQIVDRYAREASVGASDFHSLMEGIGADRWRTYMFELTGPFNRVVCHYDTLDMALLGVRSLDTLAELDPITEANQLGLKTPRRWEFSNPTHMLEVIRDWHPREFEGVVAKDAEFRRVKVKSPAYLAAHHATDSLGSSWRSVTDAVIRGAADNLAGLVPDYVQKRIDTVREVLVELTAATERDFAELRGIDDMKEFAFAAQKRAWPAALFQLKREKAVSVAEVIANATTDHIVGLCEKTRPGAFTQDAQSAGPA